MGVNIDPTRRDQIVLGIDFPLALTHLRIHRDNLTPLDCDGTLFRLRARTVYDGGVSDDKIMVAILLPGGVSYECRGPKCRSPVQPRILAA